MGRAYFSASHLEIVAYCAEECRRQRSGYDSIARMVEAWEYAARRAGKGGKIRVADIEHIARVIEPSVNAAGFRTVPATIESRLLLDPSLIERALKNLVKYQQIIEPNVWYREFEDIHPFADGNGRSGKVLFNWLKSRMSGADWPPNFWGGEHP